MHNNNVIMHIKILTLIIVKTYFLHYTPPPTPLAPNDHSIGQLTAGIVGDENHLMTGIGNPISNLI